MCYQFLCAHIIQFVVLRLTCHSHLIATHKSHTDCLLVPRLYHIYMWETLLHFRLYTNIDSLSLFVLTFPNLCTTNKCYQSVIFTRVYFYSAWFIRCTHISALHTNIYMCKIFLAQRKKKVYLKQTPKVGDFPLIYVYVIIHYIYLLSPFIYMRN